MSERPAAPTIHLNGSAKDNLLDGYATALGSLRVAEEALADTAPNARDYYPQGLGAYEAARAEHLDRMRQVQAVREQIAEILRAIRRA